MEEIVTIPLKERLGDIPYLVRFVETCSQLSAYPRQDHPTIRFSKSESVEMPFRECSGKSLHFRPLKDPILGYIARDGEPVLPVGMKQHLYDDLNRGFDD
jgi:Predicted SAM-dependent RNA methyltransferase